MTDEKRGDEENLTEEDHVMNFFKSMVLNDMAMEPYRDHAKALRANYVDNQWLTRSQMTMILKAYRAHKSELDLEDFNAMFDMVKKNINKV